MIYEAQKSSSVYNKMSFLLLSKDLGEFVRRFDYLRHYSTNRKKQADLIYKTRQDLMTQEQKVVFKKKEEEKVLVEKEGEKKKLEVLKTKEDKVVTVLTQQEKKLKSELERKKLAVRKLDNLIAGIVKREIQKSIERERKLRQARQVKKVEVAKPKLPELKKGETTKIIADKQPDKKEGVKEEKNTAVAETKKAKVELAVCLFQCHLDLSQITLVYINILP
jgi:septal ring factor EnvC (AmiA/AmiB activator)